MHRTMRIKRLMLGSVNAGDVPKLMLENAVEYNVVDTLNWVEEFPYKPSFEVALAHTGDELLIHYRVKEQSVRAVAENDQDAVWQDSCVEFFSQPNPEDGIYYNIECNCTGKILFAAGTGRHDRTPAPTEVTSLIKRWSSLGYAPFKERLEETSWEVALVVPHEVYFQHDVKSLNGLKIKANVYKCGDELRVPHFVSLYPISKPSPDFHCPEFFREMEFEE